MTQGKLAPLVFLAQAIDDLSLPIKLAEEYVCPEDLPNFITAVRTHVQELIQLCQTHAVRNRVVFENSTGDDAAYVIEVELGAARQSFALLDRVGKTFQPAEPGSEVTQESRTAQSQTSEPNSLQFAQEAEELRRLRNGELNP